MELNKGAGDLFYYGTQPVRRRVENRASGIAAVVAVSVLIVSLLKG